MNKICTSIEQSQKLIKLGIDINTADMDYIPFANDPENYDCVINLWNNEHEDDWIPAWSLTALLDVLPFPNLSKDNLGGDKEGWMVSVYPDNCRYDSCWHDNSVDACVEMVVRLHKLNLL